jgi:hypothetical protein
MAGEPEPDPVAEQRDRDARLDGSAQRVRELNARLLATTLRRSPSRSRPAGVGDVRLRRRSFPSQVVERSQLVTRAPVATRVAERDAAPDQFPDVALCGSGEPSAGEAHFDDVMSPASPFNRRSMTVCWRSLTDRSFSRLRKRAWQSTEARAGWAASIACSLQPGNRIGQQAMSRLPLRAASISRSSSTRSASGASECTFSRPMAQETTRTGPNSAARRRPTLLRTERAALRRRPCRRACRLRPFQRSETSVSPIGAPPDDSTEHRCTVSIANRGTVALG